MLEEKLLPWAQRHFGNRAWTFMQDSAPAHKALQTQDWLHNNCHDFITKDDWPSNSPDLNPLDYSIWSILQAQMNAEAHDSVDSLKQYIMEGFENLKQDMINRAVDDWMMRLDAVIASE